MTRDDVPTLVFCLACVTWGLLFALIVGACGGGQRRDCNAAVSRGGSQSDACRESR